MLKRIFLFTVIALLCAGSAQANIVLKAVGANPSKLQKQTVVIKAYLPKEVMPEHVVGKSDLDIFYDTQQCAYYIQGEYELEPGEIVEREVEMKDIWHVDESEIKSVRNGTVKIIELLKGTDYEERADFLKESIHSRLDEIDDKQKMPAVTPQRHISTYRDNLKLLEAAKDDLLVLRSFLSQIKLLPSITIWKVFFGVIVFLAILGLGLYAMWYKQSKIIAPATLMPGAEDREDVVISKYHDSDKEKEVSAKDIEDILKKKRDDSE
ncbi:hypothetical protein [Neptuniibacter sp.]|uniref:hypothetical protein n=1 Tax=Neptuniibacter sp. TaxID=1962643 RepID=UPI00261A44DE|nr:hypothetical protein [Neptuniibacter sp.]MCP4594989.1 hypothetical protein [Neptuniibacter sp.]